MDDVQVENAWRWKAWRCACEEGKDRAESYDLYLHPLTRIEVLLTPEPDVRRP